MASPQVEIRCATRADAAGAWRTFQNHLNWINVWHQNDQVVQRRLNQDRIETLFGIYPSAVAVHDDVIVGFAASEIRDIGVLEVMNLYVDDPFRKEGIGTAMLKLLEDQCRAGGVHTIVAFGSSQYYPGKRLPTGVFGSAGYDIITLTPRTEMYMRRVELPGESEEYIHPVQRTIGYSVSDLEIEQVRANTSVRVVDLKRHEASQAAN